MANYPAAIDKESEEPLERRNETYHIEEYDPEDVPISLDHWFVRDTCSTQELAEVAIGELHLKEPHNTFRIVLNGQVIRTFTAPFPQAGMCIEEYQPDLFNSEIHTSYLSWDNDPVVFVFVKPPSGEAQLFSFWIPEGKTDWEEMSADAFIAASTDARMLSKEEFDQIFGVLPPLPVTKDAHSGDSRDVDEHNACAASCNSEVKSEVLGVSGVRSFDTDTIAPFENEVSKPSSAAWNAPSTANSQDSFISQSAVKNPNKTERTIEKFSDNTKWAASFVVWALGAGVIGWLWGTRVFVSDFAEQVFGLVLYVLAFFYFLTLRPIYDWLEKHVFRDRRPFE